MKESIHLTYSFCFLSCLLDRGHITPEAFGSFLYFVACVLNNTLLYKNLPAFMLRVPKDSYVLYER